MTTNNIINILLCKNFIINKFLHSFVGLSKRDIVVGLILSSLMINTTGLMLPFTIIQMYDRVIPNKSYNTFTAFMVIVIIVLIIEAILKIMRGCISASLDVKLSYSMNVSAYKNALSSNLLEFKQHSFAVQLDRFNLINKLKEYYSGQYFITLCDIPFIVIYFIFIYCIQVYVGIAISLVCLLMLAMSYLRIIKIKQDQVYKTKSLQIISKFLIEILAGIGTVKSMGLEEQMLRRYEKLQKNDINKEFSVMQERIKYRKNISLLTNIIIMVTVFVGCLMIFKEQMTLGGLAACILLSGKIMQPIANIIMLFSKWNNFEVANQEYNKLLSIGCENCSNDKIDIINGEIKLVNADFSYCDPNGNRRFILKDVTVTFPAKKVVAIHGKDLSGKSTLMQILGCLYTLQGGDFLLDQKNIKTADLEYIREQIAFIDQESYCFQGTILENITRFRNVNLSKVLEISSKIGMHKIIQSMSNGYKTIIGVDSNDYLTKKIKQYIMVIRELIKEPKIILFDESNLNTDLESDSMLHSIIEDFKNKATVVFVSHRQSLLKFADQHYLIKNGMVSLNNEYPR